MIRGHCLCGAIRYAIEHDLTSMSHCHCSICRKSHGTNFATYTGVPASAARFESGETLVRTYASSLDTERSFCGQCGSVIHVRFTSGDQLFFPVGNLDEAFLCQPSGHIFVDSKAPWYEITDDLPQYPGYPNDSAPPGPSPTRRQTSSAGRRSGSCLCAAVAFEFQGDPVRMYNCHCSRCRLARGTAHATNLFVPRENFRWVRGEDQVELYELPEAERFAQAFCRQCGSTLARVNPAFPTVVIPVGSMDDDPGIRPSAHIYVESKSNWFPITDPLLQHPEGPPA